CQHHNTYPYSF
nr:immunoglobulin light chain junction region [Macaca mulatta]MOV61468.1 immunoglobulin light chain junction region [Macaca mulatta]MOV61954.1 immunoglobulin light chain junction region [Macaca mulatta]MOV61993.1 immunoglobulin light chain junction region [Macaca mulatta]MOV62193.1 immunoglobulin light chain junction region [Macaca mulatta]